MYPKKKVVWSFIMQPGSSVEEKRRAEASKPNIYNAGDLGQMIPSEAVSSQVKQK